MIQKNGVTSEVDVAIIGAGTAGLTAQEFVAEKIDNYAIIDDGPLGTTCARVGCMPSKALIAVADDFHKRLFFDEYGILGANALKPDYSRIMARVRMLRDEFAGDVIHEMAPFMDKLIRKRRMDGRPDIAGHGTPPRHPVPEEALRSALGQILKQIDDPAPNSRLKFSLQKVSSN